MFILLLEIIFVINFSKVYIYYIDMVKKYNIFNFFLVKFYAVFLHFFYKNKYKNTRLRAF